MTRKADARCFGQDLMRGEHTVGGGMSKTQAGKANPINKENIPGYYYKLRSGMTPEQIVAEYNDTVLTSGTSIFDPVLCELVYRWFCPVGGRILDPFAGGSVRGIVAAMLGYCYTGIDLRPEQVAANEDQAERLCAGNPPKWHVGDSRDIAALAHGEFDLIFSCPPYYDLEVYSEDARDLSSLCTYADFIAAYRAIVASSIAKLRDNRFAAFVVGDIRDSKGFYRNFVSDTITAFQDAGAMLYNEAILVTAVGSLPIRIGRQFSGGRKLGKTHQQLLVFYKGDPAKIKQEFPSVDVDLPQAEGGGDLAS